jgi:Flp pilus assembly protein TadG
MKTILVAARYCAPSASIQLNRRRGAMIWFGVIVLAVLLGFVSLGVDIGRMQTAKTEIQRAVDNAARYGAVGLTDGTSTAKAITAASDNTVDADDRRPLSLTASDITAGTWDSTTRIFTPSNVSPNAIRVVGTRTIPLLFAAALGKNRCAVTATAIAVNNAAGPNFIGLNGISAVNNTSMGYSSSKGAPGGVNQNGAFLMGSNGAITFSMNVSINGNIVLGPSGSFNKASPTPLKSATTLAYPATEAPPFISSGDLNVSGTMHITGGGTKVYTNISFSNNASLIFDSPTTVYVTGNIDAAQGSVVKAASGVPKDLMIRMSGGPTKYFGGNNANNFVVTAMVYAPEVDFNSKNNADLYGSVLFRSFDVKNNLNVYYDIDSGSVVAGLGSTGGSMISMVR